MHGECGGKERQVMQQGRWPTVRKKEPQDRGEEQNIRQIDLTGNGIIKEFHIGAGDGRINIGSSGQTTDEINAPELRSLVPHLLGFQMQWVEWATFYFLCMALFAGQSIWTNWIWGPGGGISKSESAAGPAAPSL